MRIIQGDSLEVLKTLPDESVDSIVTDPPYELGFMGKKWDNTGIAYNVNLWKECLRVLKSGGHLLAFGGSRTYHRMAVAIEDAGFEVRDMIEWVYGSGFPKSLNIGKAVDKIQGNEREVTGYQDREGRSSGILGKKVQITRELSQGTSEWEGWGTALKPSHESICVAHKPLDNRSIILYNCGVIVGKLIRSLKCQLPLNAKIAELSLRLSQAERKGESGIAVWNAVNNINIQESLFGLMDMLQSKEAESLNLNTVLLCLNFLKEICEQMNIFTTEMETSLIIELRTLNSLLSEDILANIIQVKEKNQDGKNVNACYVENYLNAVLWKLNATLTHSVQENVMSKESELNFAPNREPICMARKPLGEKTVAENCLKWGVGGINIDGCRVDGKPRTTHKYGNKVGVYENDKKFGQIKEGAVYDGAQGRFPANLIHDNSEEVRECFPETKSGKLKSDCYEKDRENDSMFAGGENFTHKGYDADSGSASRFFKSIIYTAKASKSERNEGCEGLEQNKKFVAGNYSQSPVCKTCDKTLNGTNDHSECSGEVYYREMESRNTKNNHPTVKPVELMEYLINMVTPKKGTVLDPFMGSGTTGVASKNLSREFIGIELDPEYFKIAESRINNTISQVRLDDLI